MSNKLGIQDQLNWELGYVYGRIITNIWSFGKTLFKKNVVTKHKYSNLVRLTRLWNKFYYVRS